MLWLETSGAPDVPDLGHQYPSLRPLFPNVGSSIRLSDSIRIATGGSPLERAVVKVGLC